MAKNNVFILIDTPPDVLLNPNIDNVSIWLKYLESIDQTEEVKEQIEIYRQLYEI